MPFETIPGTTERYAHLCFDKDGRERADDPDGVNGRLSEQVLARAAQDQPTHVFIFCHGWKGDIDSSRDQYNHWIGAMLALTEDRTAVPLPFRPLWVGLHWPSLPFGNEELSADDARDFDVDEGTAQSPDQIKATYLDRLDLGPEAEPLIDRILRQHRQNAAAPELPEDARQAYAELAALAGYTSDGPTGPPDAEGAPFDPDLAFARGNAAEGSDFAGGGLLGGILGPLRQLSYWTMKKRARTIGESGMHDFAAGLMKAAANARVHLMGHSFGTIVVASMLGGRGAAGQLPRQVDSVALLQGAVSLWAFGASVNGEDRPGYFHAWVKRGAIRGPLIVSQSIHDRAVGRLYPWASALSLSDASFADELPKYGAIGRFGICGLEAAIPRAMGDTSERYRFEPGKVYNLESSKFIKDGGGLSGAHSDIDGPEVAHALWQAALV
ncbi:MAG: hypothetical protein H0V80_12505 [Acidobacteria bacterium]|nr:hypothetical protein [Acidobacteriota bacterium]